MDTQQILEIHNQELKQEIEKLRVKKGGIEEHGQLSIKGTQMVDQNGNPFILRGLSSHGIAWYPEYTNYPALKTIKDYGANAFRIAMYVEQNDGYLEEPELNKKLLFSAIENSLAADLYTIVDWHVLRDEDPNHNIDEAIDILEEVAQRYGDNPGIIYEICNEPNGDTSYDDIVNYANEVIPVIRKYAPNAVILVGTPNFCTSLSEAIENPIEYPNIMYTYHYYAGVSDCKFAMEEIERGLEGGLPIFVSEWGLDSHDAKDQHWKETSEFLDYLEKEKIGWINWSLSNKDEGYSIIKPDSSKLHSWDEEDITDSGKFVFRYLSKGKD
ncbi:MAG: glycoside hydrolase family 5 protein [Eubacteriales bacterium]|nr:glycoside hydrolase family 5 protein [Eubacteriales bacterium]